MMIMMIMVITREAKSHQRRQEINPMAISLTVVVKASPLSNTTSPRTERLIDSTPSLPPRGKRASPQSTSLTAFGGIVRVLAALVGGPQDQEEEEQQRQVEMGWPARSR